MFALGGTILIAVLIWCYVRRNDKALKAQPAKEFAAFSPNRVTAKEVLTTAAEPLDKLTVADQLPPRTGRRYIVVGGVSGGSVPLMAVDQISGWLLGWVDRGAAASGEPFDVIWRLVLTCAKRGEDPKKIRVLDLKPPRRHDLLTGSAKDVDFIQLDISDRDAVYAAFTKSWPDEGHDGVTIFHTASNIRFYERHPALLHRSAKVNVQGTENIIDAAKAIGVNILLYTSSGSVAVRRSRFWLWPWESKVPFHFQVIDDDEHNHILPRRHDQFFSNYAATKMHAETLVRKADKTGQLRTGCLRPGNGIFGPGGDMLCGAYLVRKANPTWVQNTLQSFVYVENCALAHLCYEQRLIELSNGSRNPDIGGQVFHIADPGAPPTYGDVYTTLEVLTNGETYFPEFSPTVMLFIAHIIELYYLVQYYLSASTSRIPRAFGRFLPTINGDLVNLQPSLWALMQVHLVFDDSRARLSPKQGGLGYRGPWTTLEALHKMVAEYKSGVSKFDNRSDVGGVSLGWAMGHAQRGVGKVGDNIVESLRIDPLQTKN
ncbi:hypothetical protein CCMSSC00406_0008087 [Pleurotus cornucopiae]|uniref:Uncharacterized protein n=1 Tax=Pleurotus cornucopiae TaxID=5321 RepID=A0ACB7IKN3_PLECO|nr:hypothetical protein CCMSSC00406_0008087 [Pleurotus cornucopiae]